MNKKITVLDLFAGAGGLSLGFQKAGYEIKAAYDYWDKAIEVYKRNFDHPIFQIDISQLDNYDEFKKYNVDMIIGGPPCQDFSSAGKRDESLGRADLTIKYAEIIAEVKPKYFLMENVSQIEKSKAFEQACSIFKANNYGLTSVIIDASFANVPQKRKRFFMFGILNGEDDAVLNYFTNNLAKRRMTVRDYLGNSLGIEHYYRHPRNYNRRGIFSIDEPAPTVRGVNRPLPQGYIGHPKDTAPITANIRPLTTIERSLIQTFPKGYFDETIAKTHLEQMIGNAVPVNLAKYIANCISDYLIDISKNQKNQKEEQLQLF